MLETENGYKPERGHRTKPYTIASLTAVCEIFWSYYLKDNGDLLKVAIGVTPFAVALLDFGFEKYLDYRQDKSVETRRKGKVRMLDSLIKEKQRKKEDGRLNKVQRTELEKEIADLTKQKEQTMLGEFD